MKTVKLELASCEFVDVLPLIFCPPLEKSLYYNSKSSYT